ncbi:hypothetical protein EGT74_16295 [Chitinophaga lutea]|uniref:Lipocalin-like domain-containing protein n=2 Tax=Chitinophaga lutea TaxID=2488634 RepID=A0A3N4PY59_9BACT|nr:hypothetical protein EGT74_16295 [Chitinophaga lutea]
MWAKAPYEMDNFADNPKDMRNVLCWLAFATMMGGTACKKDNKTVCPPATEPLTGIWVGKYGIRSINEPGDTGFLTPMHTYTMIFHPNGTMVVYDGDESSPLLANGVYSLKKGKFYGQYAYFRGGSGEYSLNAQLLKPDSLAGTWHIGYGGPTGGSFWLKKK